MNRGLWALTIGFSLAILEKPANAGPYQDDLIKCVNRNITDSDKVNLAGFIVLAFSSLPEMQGIVFIDEIRSESLIKAYTETIERLVLYDCYDESKLVVKFEGSESLASATNLIGQMTMRDNLSDPNVVRLFDRMEQYSSPDKWNELLLP